MIAAQTVARKLILVPNNEREFGKVAGLAIKTGQVSPPGGGREANRALGGSDTMHAERRQRSVRDSGAPKPREKNMDSGLSIREAAALDFVALGALVHRLDPGVVPFRKATHCEIHVSGGEYNCAANLADCFRLRAAIVTAMVDYPIGDLIAERVRAMGVRAFYKHFEHNGVTGPNMAAVYSDRGFGVRPPVVFYNRANEAGAQLRPGDFDWKEVFAGHARWFHSGGIFASLSPETSELVLEAMAAARADGAVVSFDLNHRPKLWRVAGTERQAQAALDRIVRNVDVLVGNEEDLQKGLGLEGPEPGAPESGAFESGTRSKLDPSVFFGMIEQVVKRYPQIRAVATTLREVESASRHRWSAVAWVNGKRYSAPTLDLDVYDRVGGGDGFAAGFFYGLLAGESPEEALKLGWAHGALLATYPGDTTMATLDEVRALARGGSARIQR